METTSPITATEILDEVIQPIEPTFALDFARMVLRLRLSDAAQERIRELLQRNNAGTLDPAEKTALDNYLLVGQFLDLVRAKAHVSLQGSSAASP
jgi:hypothetical protein